MQKESLGVGCTEAIFFKAVRANFLMEIPDSSLRNAIVATNVSRCELCVALPTPDLLYSSQAFHSISTSKCYQRCLRNGPTPTQMRSHAICLTTAVKAIGQQSSGKPNTYSRKGHWRAVPVNPGKEHLDGDPFHGGSGAPRATFRVGRTC